MGLFSNLSVDFDGSNDHVVVGNVSTLSFERTDAFTISCWVRTTTTSADAIISKLTQGGNFEGWEFNLDGTTNELRFFLINVNVTNSIRVDTSGASPDPTDGQWHHLVVTYDGSSAGSGVTIYIDTVVQSVTVVDDTLSATTVTTAPVQIGARNGANVPFQGNIDDVAIYDTELGGPDVIAIYNAGSPIDNRTLSTASNLVGYWTMGDGDTFPTLRDRQVATPILAAGTMLDRSQNSNDGTPTNMEDADFTTDTPGSVSGYSATFDGVDETITVGDVAALQFAETSNFSWGFWAKWTTTTAGAMVGKRVDGGNAQGWEVASVDLGGGDVELQIILQNSGSTRVVVFTSGTALNDGSWHHICATWNGSVGQAASNLIVYVDGSPATLSISEDTLAGTIEGGGIFALGARSGTGTFFAGQLDEVAVFNKVLSQTEVTAIYNSGSPTDITLIPYIEGALLYNNLVGYWGCGELANDGTMTNMVSGDIEGDFPTGIVPASEIPFPGVFASGGDLGAIVPGAVFTLTGGQAGGAIFNFKMRALQDPGPGFETWVVQGAPDFAGTNAPGPIIGGSAIVADTWTS